MTGKLNDRVAVITGASKGLGKAMALALAAEGARIALVSRDKEQLNAVAAEIVAAGGHAESSLSPMLPAKNRCAALEREIIARYRQGAHPDQQRRRQRAQTVIDFTLEEWHSVMDTNVTSVFLMCRSFVPAMKGQGYGRILNMTSIMSHVSLPGRTAYSASKAALLGMTRTLALELAPESITVNGISPGPFGTEMNKPLMQNPGTNAQFIASIPVGRWGKVEEIGELAVYLCSRRRRLHHRHGHPDRRRLVRTLAMQPIGHVRTPFTATREIPKGLGAEHETEGTLEILAEFEAGLQDIEGFSHLYVLWAFDRAEGFDLVATPPTDDRPHGVFATRSPRRPNPLGLTVVELLCREGPNLRVRGVDMLDGTPMLDLKPYLSAAYPRKTSAAAGWRKPKRERLLATSHNASGKQDRYGWPVTRRRIWHVGNHGRIPTSPLRRLGDRLGRPHRRHRPAHRQILPQGQ